MKKSAFSYLELIICMTVVVSAIMLSTPFLTGNSGKNSDVYGEFRCFSEYDEETETYKLYQQQRYNTHTLSARKDVTEEGCTFSKPVGATSYTITLSGGGGGGASASFNYNNPDYNQITDIIPTNSSTNPLTRSTVSGLPSETRAYISSSNCTNAYCQFIHPDTGFQALVDKYATKQIQQIIKVYPGRGGSAGETITKTTTLVNNFDAEDSLKINFCKNAHISSEDIEERYCIGKGGSGGKANSLSNHYIVVGILQDLVHAHRFPSLPHTGIGDGQIDNYDKMNLLNAVNDTSSLRPNVAMANYLSSKTAGNYSALYTALNHTLSSYETIKHPDDSDGFDGEYTRFAITDSENLVAKGGKGGRTSQNTESLYDGSNVLSHAKEYISGYNYYIRKGEDGGYDARIQTNGGTQGGYCQCNNSECTNCDGNNAKYIGAGGGGGSIVFKTSRNLDKYEVTSFYLKGTDQELGAEYNVGNIPPRHEFTIATEQNKIYPEKYYTGKGGNGGGGAIIINW